MLNKRFIPCLEVENGRLTKEDCLAWLRDPGDPQEAAEAFDAQGADEIALISISDTKLYQNAFMDLVEQISGRVFVTLTAGGGVRDIDGVINLINAGADKVVVDASAPQAPDVVREAATMFGSQCIVARIEARSISLHSSWTWEICGPGGSGLTRSDAVQWASHLEQAGAGEIVLASMDMNQTKCGYDLALTRTIAECVTIPVVAAGRVGSLDHIRLGLVEGRASAAFATGNLLFNAFTIGHCKQYLRWHGVSVRI